MMQIQNIIQSNIQKSNSKSTIKDLMLFFDENEISHIPVFEKNNLLA